MNPDKMLKLSFKTCPEYAVKLGLLPESASQLPREVLLALFPELSNSVEDFLFIHTFKLIQKLRSDATTKNAESINSVLMLYRALPRTHDFSKHFGVRGELSLSEYQRIYLSKVPSEVLRQLPGWLTGETV